MALHRKFDALFALRPDVAAMRVERSLLRSTFFSHICKLGRKRAVRTVAVALTLLGVATMAAALTMP
jgi:hypothetical protein